MVSSMLSRLRHIKDKTFLDKIYHWVEVEHVKNAPVPINIMTYSGFSKAGGMS